MTDWGGVAQVLTASGVLITALLSGVATVLAAKAKKQSEETHVAVNSRMEEFKRLFESKFRLEGAADEKDKQQVVTAAAAATATAVAPAMLAAAEVKAAALIAEATSAAAKVLSEAHRVAITNQTSEPVPMQIVSGPGVDEPLAVTAVTEGKRKRKK